MSTPWKKRMELDKNGEQIVVIGAALAGLSAAFALEHAGFKQVLLYGRDNSFDEQKEGYGLTLTYNP